MSQTNATFFPQKPTSLTNVLAPRLGGHCWLLPALTVRQRLLLLTCDEGGAPHRAAVAVPKPTNRG